MTFAAVLIMCCSFILLIVSLGYFLGHAEMLFGFNKESKETEATVVGFITRGLDTADDPQSANPIIEYYNEFTGETVRKEMLNSGMLAEKDAGFEKKGSRIVSAGERVKVQYTYKKVRVTDSRFVSQNKYNLSRYLIPPIICIGVGWVGFLLLVISII